MDENFQDRIKETVIKVGQSQICFDIVYFSKKNKCILTPDSHDPLRVQFPSEGSGLKNSHKTLLQKVNEAVLDSIKLKLKTSAFKIGTGPNAECIKLEDRNLVIPSNFLGEKDNRLITLQDFDRLEVTTLHC